jgi:LysR family nitrogen assimilation transcriptional regulator
VIKLRQLIYLKKAIDVGNITKAAEQLHVAQTALGIQIRNLEDELGVQLLERHSRGVTATTAGDLLYRHAEDILNRVEEARRAVMAQGDDRPRTLSLGLTPSIIRLVGDDIVMGLAESVPGVSLHITEDFSFALMRQLAQGDLDCVLSYAPQADPKFERLALLEEDLFYITSPEEARETGPITFREVLSADLALTGREDAVYQRAGQRAAPRARNQRHLRGAVDPCVEEPGGEERGRVDNALRCGRGRAAQGQADRPAD